MSSPDAPHNGSLEKIQMQNAFLRLSYDKKDISLDEAP
jgi:hypothetical protein